MWCILPISTFIHGMNVASNFSTALNKVLLIYFRLLVNIHFWCLNFSEVSWVFVAFQLQKLLNLDQNRNFNRLLFFWLKLFIGFAWFFFQIFRFWPKFHRNRARKWACLWMSLIFRFQLIKSLFTRLAEFGSTFAEVIKSKICIKNCIFSFQGKMIV